MDLDIVNQVISAAAATPDKNTAGRHDPGAQRSPD